jgi:hypothetical protein
LRSRIDQQLHKIRQLTQKTATLERFWVEASQYDAFVVQYNLYKLRKVLPRRDATIVVRRPIHEKDRNGQEEMGISVIVTRSGEVFVHPIETISEVSLLPLDKGTRGAALSKGERAFKVKYNDGSKTDWFEGSCYEEVMDMLRSCQEEQSKASIRMDKAKK